MSWVGSQSSNVLCAAHYISARLSLNFLAAHGGLYRLVLQLYMRNARFRDQQLFNIACFSPVLDGPCEFIPVKWSMYCQHYGESKDKSTFVTEQSRCIIGFLGPNGETMQKNVLEVQHLISKNVNIHL